MPITTIKGDATSPAGLGVTPIIIPHVCNDVNAWGAGFVLAVTRKFGRTPQEAYHHWGDLNEWLPTYNKTFPNVKVVGKMFELGSTQFVKLPEHKVVIANMIAQNGVGFNNGRPPIRYGALATCMKAVADVAIGHKAEIHCPKFGSDLAGGNWDAITLLIQELWTDNGINVTVYEFEPKK